MRTLTAGLAATALAATPLAAQTLTRDYQAVMHVTSMQSINVMDNAAHVMAVLTFRGLAIFGDGTVVPHRYEGWLDAVGGSGDFRGVARWALPDGTVSAKYEGIVGRLASDDFEFRATMHDFSGTGAYDGATGTGTFAGRRMEPVEDGGATYVEGTFTLTLSGADN